MKHIGIYLFLIVISLSACNQQVKNERLARIDSLQRYLPAVQSVLNEIDSARLQVGLNQIQQRQDWIFENVQDTFTKGPGMIISDYIRMEKYLGQSLMRFNEVKNELKYTRSQLNDLRTDVEEASLSEEEFNGYFNTEAEAVAELNDAAGDLATKYESIITKFNKLDKASAQVVDSIKAVIYSDKPL